MAGQMIMENLLANRNGMYIRKLLDLLCFFVSMTIIVAIDIFFTK